MHLSKLWFQPFPFVMYTPVLFQPSIFPFEDTLLHALPCIASFLHQQFVFFLLV